MLLYKVPTHNNINEAPLVCSDLPVWCEFLEERLGKDRQTKSTVSFTNWDLVQCDVRDATNEVKFLKLIWYGVF